MQHEMIAREIVRDIERGVTLTKASVSKFRQGDVIGVLVSSQLNTTDKIPSGILLVREGSNGQHLLIGQVRSVATPNHIEIAGEALLVHTDEPENRHPAYRLAQGVWKFSTTQELSLESSLPVPSGD